PEPGPSGTKINVVAEISSAGLCGPRQGTLTTLAGSTGFTFNVTAPFQDAPNHFVVEAEAGDLQGLAVVSSTEASGGQAVAIASSGAPGELRLRFQVPATSSTYQLYALYGTPEDNAVRTDLEITSGGATVASYKIALPKVPAGTFSLASLYDSNQAAPPTLLSLEAGKTYELRIASRPGQRYPILDLLVLSDGALPPTLTELCR
ncbi:MAG: hypothetical protein KDD82_04000, partial [Planctomycetes bacterium]|nr:hypothetical protein [Planctomycetota bacterium]